MNDKDFSPDTPISALRHDMMTPLNAIIGYGEMLLEDAQEFGEETIISKLQTITVSGQELDRRVNEFFDGTETVDELNTFKNGKRRLMFQSDIRALLNRVTANCDILKEELDTNIIKGFDKDIENIQESCDIFLTRFKSIFVDPLDDADDINAITKPSSGLYQARESENLIYPTSDRSTPLITGQERLVLVVDDIRSNRDLLSRYLKRLNLKAFTANNGNQALEMVASQPFDLILLDVMMPGIDGLEVLKRLKNNDAWRDIPVIMISALNGMDSVVNCIELGADDYLPKPFNQIILKARINNCLERKRLSDIEKEHKKILNETFGKYVSHDVRDEVLSGRIKLEGDRKDVTVMFADLRDFTPLTESIPPKVMVRILNNYFSEMAPAIRSRLGSILQYLGDEIYAVFGAPNHLGDHPRQAILAALDMRQRLIAVNKSLESQGHAPLRHGIGIHSGPVVAANLGSSERLTYGLVGDTVNLASRVQGLTKKYNTDIIITAQNRMRLESEFAVEALPATLVKGKNSPIKIFKVL